MKIQLIILYASLVYCYKDPKKSKLDERGLETNCEVYLNMNLTWVPELIQEIRDQIIYLPIMNDSDRNMIEIKAIHHEDNGQPIPESFDAREKWRNCESISEIRDQGRCGSCWAVSSASMMSDRICIHSNQTDQVRISAIDIVACCKKCGSCKGGSEISALDYWAEHGIVSGGLTNNGCKPYPFPMGDETPACMTDCREGSGLTYKNDKRYGSYPYAIMLTERQIQLEIMKNGPVVTSYTLYTSGQCYKSGVYQPTISDKPANSSHVVKIIGWGAENGVPYWTISNSWGRDAGEDGIFKFWRTPDSEQFKFPGLIFAAMPKLQ